MRIISIANQKGGCGKTTTAINLASALGQNGKRVLLIDLDPQAHASLGLDIESQDSLYNVISKLTPRKLKLENIIRRVEDTFDIVPSNILVGTLEQELADEIGRELKLKEIIEPLNERYDYILIDCPPSLGILTVNALRLSDELVIPVETSRFSMQGVMHLTDIVNLVRDRLDHEVKTRILITMFDSRLRHSFSMLETFKQTFDSKIYSTIIHVNVKLKEAAVNGKSVSAFDKYCRGSKDYYTLAKEMIAYEKQEAEEQNAITAEEVEKVFQSSTFAETVKEERDASSSSETTNESAEDVKEAQEATAANARETKSTAPETETSTSEKVELTPVSEKLQQIVKSEAGDLFEVVFNIEAPGAKSVYVTGSFNDWSLDDTCRLKDATGDGAWETRISLKPGTYKYQFIVDGVWQEDPKNPQKERNSFGDINSLIEVAEAV